jgi:hypothetical protein
MGVLLFALGHGLTFPTDFSAGSTAYIGSSTCALGQCQHSFDWRITLRVGDAELFAVGAGTPGFLLARGGDVFL